MVGRQSSLDTLHFSATEVPMGSEAEPAKQLLPYLQRADELQKHDPLVAYYCRLWAMEKGMNIPSKERTKTTNSILVSLMNQLEKDKKTIELSPDDNLHIEGFASSIFEKADKQDRMGRADLNTAKTFYAAFVFFDVLGQFGELKPDIEQKIKYAVWKAAEIRKALKEGRKPQPGPPGADQDLSSTSGVTSSYDLRSSGSFSNGSPILDKSPSQVDKDLKSSVCLSTGRLNLDSYSPKIDKSISKPTNFPPPPYHKPNYPSADIHHSPPSKMYLQQSYPTDNSSVNYDSPEKIQFDESPPHNYYPPEPPSHPDSCIPIPPYPYPNFQMHPSFNGNTICPVKTPSPSVEKIAEALKAAKSAVGALAFDDVPVAVDFLKQSLELLTNPSAQTP